MLVHSKSNIKLGPHLFYYYFFDILIVGYSIKKYLAYLFMHD